MKNIKPFQSLTFSTLLSMGIRITIVISVAAFVSYLHIVKGLEEKTLDELEKYISERVGKESKIFQLAEDNHATFKQHFLALWQHRQHADPHARFEELFTPFEDGTYLLKPDSFYGRARSPLEGAEHYLGETRWISGFIGKNTPVHEANFQNRLLLSYDLVDRFADGWDNRFANTYVSLPEGVNIVYWPELNWAEGATPDLDIPAEEWVYIVNKENNPQRESAWTGLYYDQTADQWMVSCETPVDSADGQHLINVGHDILLDNVFERVFNDHLPGAYNFIFRNDGRLIAHPNYVDDLKEKLGLFNIQESGSPSLQAQYQDILATSQVTDGQPHIVESVLNTDEEAFLAFGRIQGPDWTFVTVYPKSLLSSTAKSTAEFIFYLGVLSLIIELLMLYLVVKRKVITPLQSFNEAAVAVSQGNYDIRGLIKQSRHTKHNDEISVMRDTMMVMAGKIADNQKQLEQEVRERTVELEEAKQTAENQARTDPLTDLPNRRAFFEYARYQVAQAKRHHQPLSLIMLDIDHFKDVNDNFGHTGGDEVLKTIAHLLKDCLRPTDMVARVGGEEFVILMNSCELAAAINVAQKICDKMKAKAPLTTHIPITITGSFGVAEFTPYMRDIDDLLNQADKALYRAKQNGRDRVEVAQMKT